MLVGLPLQEKQAIFLTIAKCEYAEMTQDQVAKATARKYEITEDLVSKIRREGMVRNWPKR